MLTIKKKIRGAEHLQRLTRGNVACLEIHFLPDREKIFATGFFIHHRVIRVYTIKMTLGRQAQMADITTGTDTAPEKNQMAILQQYATATLTAVIGSSSELDPKDRIMDEMLPWCREQGTIIVLKSATILSSDPASRTVQNCKSLML